MLGREGADIGDPLGVVDVGCAHFLGELETMWVLVEEDELAGGVELGCQACCEADGACGEEEVELVEFDRVICGGC